MSERAPLSGIILAGGRSRRLGIDKTTMPWPPPAAGEAAAGDVGEPAAAVAASRAPAAQTLLGATAAKLAQICAEIVLVGYRGTRPLPYRTVPDAFPDGGSLGGIYSGLAAASCEFAVAVATDMPFLSLALLRWMLAQPRDYDVLVPVREEPEPLHAIYRTTCLEPMRRRLEAGRLKITGFFEDVRVRYVTEDVLRRLDPHGRSFFNINTPDDLALARQILADEQGDAGAGRPDGGALAP